MPISAVLLDLDGLIADTEPLQVEALRAAVSPLGVTLSDEYVARKIVGFSDEQNARDIVADFALDVDPGEILRVKEREFSRLASTCRISPMPGLWEFMGRVRPRAKRVAVVSSSTAEAVGLVLEGIAPAGGCPALALHFDVVVSGSDVVAVKPAPDVYHEAVARLAVPSNRCIALEDSAAGVEAAGAAGIRCIAVPNGLTREQDFTPAWRVCSSLAEAALLIEVQLPTAGAGEGRN
jgi:beta-phosphoglucomutase-like phosphatase (HAD superfamily)